MLSCAAAAAQDTSTGRIVAQHRTRLGPCDVMRHNPWNGVQCLGHANGVVSMWTPNSNVPVVKLLCHRARPSSAPLLRDSPVCILAPAGARCCSCVNSCVCSIVMHLLLFHSGHLRVVLWAGTHHIWAELLVASYSASLHTFSLTLYVSGTVACVHMRKGFYCGRVQCEPWHWILPGSTSLLRVPMGRFAQELSCAALDVHASLADRPVMYR